MMIINLQEIKTSVTFEQAMEQCRKMKLVEFMDHGTASYVRLTQKGFDTAAVLMQLLADHAEAAEKGELLQGS